MNHAASDRLIGWRLFTDGAERPVYEETDGCQHVEDDDARGVEAAWITVRPRGGRIPKSFPLGSTENKPAE